MLYSTNKQFTDPAYNMQPMNEISTSSFANLCNILSSTLAGVTNAHIRYATLAYKHTPLQRLTQRFYAGSFANNKFTFFTDRYIDRDPAATNYVQIIWLNQGGKDAVKRYITNNSEDLPEEWTNASILLSVNPSVLCKVYTYKGSIFIVTNKYDELAIATSLILPSLLHEQYALPETNLITDLIKLVSSGYAPREEIRYMARLQNLSQNLNRIADMQALNDIPIRLKNTRKIIITNKIKDTERGLYNLQQSYEQGLLTLRTAQIELLDIEHTQISIKYLKHLFTNTPHIQACSLNRDNILILNLIAPLQNFEEAFIPKILNSAKSYSDENTIKILSAILDSDKYELWTYSYFKFNLVNKDVILAENEKWSSGARNGSYVPHPHLMEMRCLGTFAPRVKKSLVDNDLDSCTALCLEATKNINLLDGIVVERFCRNIAQNLEQDTLYYPVKNKETGEFISFYQLLKELN